MWRDPIVEEGRKVGEAYAARFGFDVNKMFQALAKSQNERARSSTTRSRATSKKKNTVSKRRRAA